MPPVSPSQPAACASSLPLKLSPPRPLHALPHPKALKKLIKKLGKEFGPWTMLAVLLLENISHLKGIFARVVGWLAASCPGCVKRSPLLIKEAFTSLVRSGPAAARHAAGAAAALVNTRHAAYALLSALFLHYFPTPPVPEALVAPMAAAAHAAQSAAVYAATSVRSGNLPLLKGLLTGLGLAWTLRLLQPILKLTIHLRIAAFFRRRLSPDAHGTTAAAAATTTSSSTSSSNARARPRVSFAAPEPRMTLDGEGGLESSRETMSPQKLIASSAYVPKPPITWEAPSSRGSDALHVCQPMMKRRRSLLRRRALTERDGGSCASSSSPKRGGGSLLGAPTSALQSWQPVSSCRRCRWRVPNNSTAATLEEMLLGSDGLSRNSSLRDLSLSYPGSPSSHASFEWPAWGPSAAG